MKTIALLEGKFWPRPSLTDQCLGNLMQFDANKNYLEAGGLRKPSNFQQSKTEDTVWSMLCRH